MENAVDADLQAVNRRLRAAIDHRDVLLREVYHRTRNNLQLIDAILTIESAQMGAEEEAQSLRRVSERVRALGVVHGTLIGREDRSQLNIAELLERLARQIAAAEGPRSEGVVIHVEADSDLVEIDHAVPIGLIANELITNAFRHGLAHRSGGRIDVGYRVEGDAAWLAVSDDGPADASLEPDAGTGLSIVRSLVRQLDADLSVSTSSGTRVEITMPRATALPSIHTKR
jgi:two-component sensor histidine kinase